MMRYLLRFNWLLALCAAALTVLGVVFIGSAGAARSVAALQTAWRSHALTAIGGFALMFTLAALDYRKLLDWAALPYFALSLILLVAVLFLGSRIYGGRRWLWFFQPSELAKLATILFLAQVFGRFGDRLCGFRGFLTAMALLVPPILLILAEPDLGTALVLVPTAVAMLLAARIWAKGMLVMILVGTLAAGTVLGAVKAAGQTTDPDKQARIYAYLPFKPHQLARLKTFVDPDADPYGSGWNLRQAKISIGSGSLSGKGIGRGEAKFLGYLPPSVSMNDFIFAVLAEEAGFIGAFAQEWDSHIPVWIVNAYQGDEWLWKGMYGYNGVFISLVPAWQDYESYEMPGEHFFPAVFGDAWWEESMKMLKIDANEVSVQQAYEWLKEIKPIFENWAKDHPYAAEYSLVKALLDRYPID